LKKNHGELYCHVANRGSFHLGCHCVPVALGHLQRIT
jgi:hypothetical protein